VVGPQFHSLHKFFEDQYEELDEIVDEVAERVRSLGGQSIAFNPSITMLAFVLDSHLLRCIAPSQLCSSLNFTIFFPTIPYWGAV
jgi:hypothetical protein